MLLQGGKGRRLSVVSAGRHWLGSQRVQPQSLGKSILVRTLQDRRVLLRKPIQWRLSDQDRKPS